MKLTNCVFALLILAAPVAGRADNLAEELLDSTHDLRAQVELKQETIPSWENQISDSFSVVNGGNPFSQGMAATIDDNAPGLDVDSTAAHRVTSLEDVSEE
jgi:hypothetical protein